MFRLNKVFLIRNHILYDISVFWLTVNYCKILLSNEQVTFSIQPGLWCTPDHH